MNDEIDVKIKGYDRLVFAPLVEAVMQSMHKLVVLAQKDPEVHEALCAVIAYAQEPTPQLSDKVTLTHIRGVLDILPEGRERGGEGIVDVLLNANELPLQEMSKRGGTFDPKQLAMREDIAAVIRAARFEIKRDKVTFHSPLDRTHPATAAYDKEKSVEENGKLNIAEALAAGINPGEGVILPNDGFWRDAAAGGRAY